MYDCLDGCGTESVRIRSITIARLKVPTYDSICMLAVYYTLLDIYIDGLRLVFYNALLPSLRHLMVSMVTSTHLYAHK